MGCVDIIEEFMLYERAFTFYPEGLNLNLNLFFHYLVQNVQLQSDKTSRSIEPSYLVPR